MSGIGGRMEFWQRLLIAVIGGALPVALLALVGQRFIAYWDIRKKRQETDLEISRQFQDLYGKFREGSQLWRTFCRKTYYKQKYPKLPAPEDSMRWELLKRAAADESGLEAVLIKLATEHSLNEPDTFTLGMFRQGYQQLRESIRGDTGKTLPGFPNYKDPRYHLFDDYACKVAVIISTAKRPRTPRTSRAKTEAATTAAANLQRIKNVRSDDWEKSAGDATIPARNTSVEVKTNMVTGKSHVFVKTKSDTSISLTVVSQTPGASFTVKRDTLFDRSIKFNWWVVN